MQSPGSNLMQCAKPRPDWCLTPFQAFAEQSAFHGQDSGVKSGKGISKETTNAARGAASRRNHLLQELYRPSRCLEPG